jgi:hypothetical protein
MDSGGLTVKHGRLLAMAACIGIAPAEHLFAYDWQVGGLLFGDVYHVASHHSEAGDGATGAVLRRGYLTFDGRGDRGGFGRLRFELNQSGAFETYTFEADVKDLYLGRKLGRHQVIVGLSPTLTYDRIESVWGLRYLARTPMDLQGVPSRDTGISIRGPLNASGTFSYRAMAGLGVEFGADSNDHRKWMGAVTWQPDERWIIDAYLDFERIGGLRDRSTAQLFAAYQGERLRWGGQYSNQDREDDPPLELASAFLVKGINDKVSLIGRVDRLLEPSPRGDGIAYLPMDPSARATLLFAGVEFRLNPQLLITPNVVHTRYDRNADGVRPEDDLHLRLTLFLNFE